MRSRSVLVVDDDADSRDLVAEFLSDAGFEVQVAADGVDAIAILEREAPPSVIVTDLMMPNLGGCELIAYVRAAPQLRAIPVAVMSGTPDLAPVGTRVFTKPLQIGALLLFVCDAIAD